MMTVTQEITATAEQRSTASPRERVQSVRVRRTGRSAGGDLEHLVAAASAGDEHATAELVNRYAARIRAVARAHRLAAHDVEDVMQTTWLRLLQCAGTIRNPTAIGAWLETTARRECLRILKTSNREYPADTQDVFDRPEPPVASQLTPSPECLHEALTAALEHLTGHQRALILTLFSESAPHYDDVSRALGMPIGSIGPTRSRALRRLRENAELRDLAAELR